MTTTVMRNSIVGDDWIRQTAKSVPIQRIINPNTGQPTDDFLTGPVRLSFENIFVPQKNDGGNDVYGATLLFTPFADFTPLNDEYNRIAMSKFPENFNNQNGQFYGLHSPFHYQDEKAMKYGGYTPGLVYFTASSTFKPSVVDIRLNPIVDPSKVYAGVWAIGTVRGYDYSNKKKGVGFGLQSLMIIGDDTKLGGEGPDPRTLYAGINISAPIVRPDMAAQMGGAPGAVPGVPGFSSPAGAPVGNVAPPTPAPHANVPLPGGTPAGGFGAAPATSYPSNPNDISSFLK